MHLLNNPEKVLLIEKMFCLSRKSLVYQAESWFIQNSLWNIKRYFLLIQPNSWISRNMFSISILCLDNQCLNIPDYPDNMTTNNQKIVLPWDISKMKNDSKKLGFQYLSWDNILFYDHTNCWQYERVKFEYLLLTKIFNF